MYIYCTHTLHYNYNYGAYLCSIIIVAVACTNMVVIGACCDVAANMAIYIYNYVVCCGAPACAVYVFVAGL